MRPLLEESAFSCVGGLEESLREFIHLVDVSNLAHCPGIDAIFLCTRGRPLFVADAALMLSEIGDKAITWCLPSSPADLPPQLPVAFTLPSSDEWRRFEMASSRLRTPRTAIGAAYSVDWDLPMKRLFAIWVSRQRGFQRILLLDDDIREVNHDNVKRMRAGIASYSMAGAYSDDFLDTSVVGHAGEAAGVSTRAFLSGNCLAINLSRAVPFFPPIYNEDWLAVLPSLLMREAASFGSVKHLSSNPFKTPALARFQEPGDFFVDAIFEMGLVNLRRKSFSYGPNLSELFAQTDFENATSDAFWAAKLHERISFLAFLKKAHMERRDIIECLDAAIQTSRGLQTSLFTEFFDAWVSDATAWPSICA